MAFSGSKVGAILEQTALRKHRTFQHGSSFAFLKTAHWSTFPNANGRTCAAHDASLSFFKIAHWQIFPNENDHTFRKICEIYIGFYIEIPNL